jgi:hypothetical protein
MVEDRGNSNWMVVAIASIRADIDSLKREIAALRIAQEDWAKKEYAALLVGRIAHRLVRIGWYAGIAIAGYALTNWALIKSFVESGGK